MGAWDSGTLWLQTEQCVKGQALSQGKPGAPTALNPPSQHSRGWGGGLLGSKVHIPSHDAVTQYHKTPSSPCILGLVYLRTRKAYTTSCCWLTALTRRDQGAERQHQLRCELRGNIWSEDTSKGEKVRHCLRAQLPRLSVLNEVNKR